MFFCRVSPQDAARFPRKPHKGKHKAWFLLCCLRSEVISGKQQLETERARASERTDSLLMSVCVSDVLFSLGLESMFPEVLECQFIIKQELVAGSELAGYVSSPS